MESLSKLKRTAEKIATDERIVPYVALEASYDHIENWCKTFLKASINIECTSFNVEDERRKKEDILKSIIDL